MRSSISLKGIDQAISNLDYRNADSLKYRLVQTLKNFYNLHDSIESLRAIDSNTLIKKIWDTDDDPFSLKSKRKNLNIIKSSINADLIKLYEQGKNPDGIIIGPSNIFEISDEAKDKLLSSLTNAIGIDGNLTLNKVNEVLRAINKFLSGVDTVHDDKLSYQLNELLNIIEKLSIKTNRDDCQDYEPIKKPGRTDDERQDDGAKTGNASIDDSHLEISAHEAQTPADAEEGLEIVDDILEDAETLDEIDAEDVLEAIEEAEADALEPADPAETGGADPAGGRGIDTGPGGADPDAHEAQTPADAEEDLEIVDDILEDAETLDEIDAEDVLEAIEHDAAVGEIDEMMDDAEMESINGEALNNTEKESSINQIGLPFDNLDWNEFSLEDYKSDKERERLLAEQFDGYLGAMERYYNQYLLILSGKYNIGTKNSGKAEHSEKGISLHQFFMGKYPVTNALFEIFIERTGYKTTAEELGYGMVYSGRFQKTIDKNTGLVKAIWNTAYIKKNIKGACWYQPTGPGSSLYNKRNHPVVQVSLRDSLSFAAWTGKRLPSELEWEAAARTKKGALFPWGNVWKDNMCNVEDCGISDTTAVGHYAEGSNDLGISDTLGNVREWTTDECNSPYPKIKKSNYHIVKGGSWISSSSINLCSRFMVEADHTSNILGFRCVVD